MANAQLDDLKIHRPDAPDAKGRRVWIAIAAIGLACIAGFFGWQRGCKDAGAIEVQTVVVRDSATQGSSSTVLNGSGYVTPRREATVSSKVTGKVVEVNIEEGMRVTNGQVLARIDDTNIRASLDLAQAQIEAAHSALGETRVRLDEARKEHIRVTKLAFNKIATEAELDRAEAEVSSLEARLKRQEVETTVAQRQLALWQQQLDDTVIRAPFAGVIVAKNAQPGEMISPMSAGGGFTRTGICTIVDMESLEIEVDVSESLINRVSSGQRVESTLDSYPDWKIPSKVIAVVPTADRGKQTVKVRVGFDKLDARILPQMSVKVAFHGSGGGPNARQKQIPAAAVQREGNQDVAFVVQDGKAERRAITVSGTSGDHVIVQAGLSDGDHVIINQPPGLTEGMRVKNLAK